MLRRSSGKDVTYEAIFRMAIKKKTQQTHNKQMMNSNWKRSTYFSSEKAHSWSPDEVFLTDVLQLITVLDCK